MGNKRKYKGLLKQSKKKKIATKKAVLTRYDRKLDNVEEVCQSEDEFKVQCQTQYSEEPSASNQNHTENQSKPECDGIKLPGRRIIHIEHFLEELKKFAEHNTKFGCSLSNLVCENEKRFGLWSKLTFKCNFCNFRQVIETDSKASTVLDINKCAVSGIMSIGGAFSALDQFLSALDVPSMTDKLYNNVQNGIEEEWQETAGESMAEAAAKERDAALEEGRVTKNGVPIIDVVVDGCWAKRSYRTNYSSLSGVASIIGKKYGQVLFLAVRNKYCSICAHITRTGKEIQHICYKNYDCSSTSMEADILVEGFRKSISMYNVIYGRVVADGDASTYSKILEANPYTDVMVEKIECTNHILRNFCNKMRAATTDTRYPIRHRKLLTVQRIMSMRKNIKKAIKHYNTVNETQSKKISSLHSDINNILMHTFHWHTNCKAYYCSETKPGNSQFTNELKGSGFWLRVTMIVSTVAAHARSLIQEMNSNIVESFNSTIAKYVGGKRINYTTRGSYQARCFAAALSFNTKMPLYTLHRKMLFRTPTSIIKRKEELRYKRLLLNKKYQRVKRRIFTVDKKEKANYGQNAETEDMTPEALEENKKLFLSTLADNKAKRDEIEQETSLQRDNPLWIDLHKKMLTSSNFGVVGKRKTTISAVPLLKRIMYGKSLANVASIKFGIANENIALQQLAVQENLDIQPCGMFIDKDYAFLGASPDGIADNGKMTVEVKCSISAYKIGLENAIKSKKITFWVLEDGEYKINKKHNWYYQIQGTLHITKRNTCAFGLWTGEDKPIKVEYIQRNDDFWKALIPNLERFYMEGMLPEIVDPRFRRSKNIREPEYIVKAIKEKSDKLENDKVQKNKFKITAKKKKEEHYNEKENEIPDEEEDILNVPKIKRQKLNRGIEKEKIRNDETIAIVHIERPEPLKNGKKNESREETKNKKGQINAYEYANRASPVERILDFTEL